MQACCMHACGAPASLSHPWPWSICHDAQLPREWPSISEGRYNLPCDVSCSLSFSNQGLKHGMCLTCAAEGRLDYLKILAEAYDDGRKKRGKKHGAKYTARMLNRRNLNGQTALMLACKYGYATLILACVHLRDDYAWLANIGTRLQYWLACVHMMSTLVHLTQFHLKGPRG